MIFDIIRASYKDKVRYKSIEDCRKIGVEMNDYFFNVMTEEEQNSLEWVWWFFKWKYVLKAKTSIGEEYCPTQTYIKRKYRLNYLNTFFNWTKLSKKNKQHLEILCGHYYSHTIYEFYKAYAMFYWKHTEESFEALIAENEQP